MQCKHTEYWGKVGIVMYDDENDYHIHIVSNYIYRPNHVLSILLRQKWWHFRVLILVEQKKKEKENPKRKENKRARETDSLAAAAAYTTYIHFQ